MDPKARVEQMLRKRREAEISHSETDSSVVAGTLASNLNRIRQILKQKSATSQPLDPVVQPLDSRFSEGPACLYCGCSLVSQNGLLQCSNCRKSFTFRVVDGEMVDVERLLYGVCRCCLLRKPIVRSRGFMVCSLSDERYVEYRGEYLRLLDLPFGLCSCCESPRPLTANSQSEIICTDTGVEYVRNLDGAIVRKPPSIDLSSASSVEAALNDGTAQFYYGGFIGNTNRH